MPSLMQATRSWFQVPIRLTRNFIFALWGLGLIAMPQTFLVNP
jgi:hypothetical protein